MAKGKFGKIIAAIASIAVIAGASIFAYNALNPQNPGPGPNPDGPGYRIEQLAAPEDVSYNKDSYVLTWEGVDNASGYTIYYNGTEFDVDAADTQEHITVTAQQNTFKVKALGDDVNYSDSEWSEECTYTISQTQEQSVYDKVNIKLAETLAEKDYELVEVIGISYVNIVQNSDRENIVFQTISKRDGVEKNVAISFQNDGKSTVAEILEDFDDASVRFTPQKSIVEYNSAQRLIDSGEYDGQMQQLKNQGYEISVVNSCVREGSKVGSKFRFEIVGTYKAVNGSDVKYFTSVNRVDVLNPSSNAENNYKIVGQNSSYRTVTETSFVMHEAGGTLEYMEDWAKVNDPAAASLMSVRTPSATVSISLDFGEGMEQ